MLKKSKKVIAFSDLEKSFRYHKKKAGGIKYVACFGKTFLEREHATYAKSKDVGKCLIENGFGILHGGYSGAMEAVSSGADLAISDSKKKNAHWNIGAPMQFFDKELKRSSKINLPIAKDIVDRKKALTHFCDACIVLPSGGMGTLLETLELFHLNQIAQKFGGKIRPIILIGKHWKKMFDHIIKMLDMKNQKGGDDFIYFIDTIDQLIPVLNGAIDDNY